MNNKVAEFDTINRAFDDPYSYVAINREGVTILLTYYVYFTFLFFFLFFLSHMTPFQSYDSYYFLLVNRPITSHS